MAVFGVIMLCCVPAKARAEISTVTTIAPLHSLAAGVLKGISTPALLIRSTRSPHDYKLRPAELKMLDNANIIIGVDESFETGLKRPILRLKKTAEIIWFMDVRGVTHYPFRGSGLWRQASPPDQSDAGGVTHSGTAHHAGHGETTDPHLWLDPGNAIIFVQVLAKLAAGLDKTNAATIRQNAKQLEGRLRKLDDELKRKLMPVIDKPFIVYHDAYQYFEKRYGLRSLGAVASDAHVQPGARHLVRLRNIFKSGRVKCLFTEPQFPPGLAHRLISGTGARLGALDPLGAAIEPGSDHYFMLMRNLADDFASCLAHVDQG